MTPTARLRYSAGPWLCLVRGRRLVALPADASEETAAVVWDLLVGEPGVEQLLATVLSGRLDLTGLPSFAIVSFEAEAVHAFLRGGVHLRMTGPGACETRLSGTGVSTWNERVIPDVQAFELLVDDAVPHAENLPLEAGAVRLSALFAEVRTAREDAGDGDVRAGGDPLVAAVVAGPAVLEQAPPVEEPVLAEPRGNEAPAVPGEDPAPAAEHGPAEPRDIEMTISPETVEYAAAPGAEAAPAVGVEAHADAEVNADVATEADVEAEPEIEAEVTAEAHADTAADDDVDAEERTLIRAPRGPAATEDPAAGPAPVPEPGGLIDSVPWLVADRATVPGPAPAGGPARAEDGGQTVGLPPDLGMTVEPYSPPDAHPDAHPDDDADADTVLSPSAAAARPAGVPDPDHDGQTVMRSGLDLADAGPAAPAAPQLPAITGPLVLARQCSDGHASPPISTTCLTCGQSLSGEARQVRRPSLGRIRMSTGEVLELDRPAVIGRQPQARRVASGTMPRMIQVRSPHGDISRSHCEVVLEGWHVQLRDLKATNGTILIREGQSPRRLGQGESVMVLDGDIADLGDGVSLRFEAIP